MLQRREFLRWTAASVAVCAGTDLLPRDAKGDEGPVAYIAQVKPGVLNWMESVRCSGPWGRWKYNAAMTRPWALQASGIAIGLHSRLGVLADVPAAQKQEAIEFFQSCQDPKDRLFKDPLETEAEHKGEHTWEQIWGQRNGATLGALELLGAKPKLGTAPAQFVDLSEADGREWTLSLDWRNPWRFGESWSRAIKAYVQSNPEGGKEAPVLTAMFKAMEAEILDPATGYPIRRGCEKDLPRAMAGFFKIMSGYLAVGRPIPHAEKAIDSTLKLQHENGEFGYRRNMCMNWDALWVLRELDLQIKGAYRHEEIVKSGNRTAELLMKEYLKKDGAFAFHGDHCMTNHHSVRLCEKPLPISDMLGTMMCLKCLEYADEWNGKGGQDGK